ncbi:MAG: 3-hydroxyacyl-CoA dehydrogenase family protein [Deltaproteobacteria bacterium]|nr:3-hydroxyacyl-CoA dehydrogenase family protein [Deltaproteobacteria bacterium]
MQIDEIQRVTLVGMGVIGTQIAIQSACHGYKVFGFDEVPESFERANRMIFSAMEAQQIQPVVGLEAWKQGMQKVLLTGDLEQAVSRADLVIEAVPERLELKRQVFADLDRLAPAPALLASNSSSIPISRIQDATKRPAQCLNLHFYFPALGINLVDVMGGEATAPATLEAGAAWVRSIGCLPIRLKKETFGFCFNRMQHAARREALHMWAEGAVEVEDADRAWMVGTGMPFGLFGMMDQVGLDVVYNVEMSYYNETGDARFLPPEPLKDMVDRGELGYKTGKGFYTYPNPEYKNPDFLS